MQAVIFLAVFGMLLTISKKKRQKRNKKENLARIMSGPAGAAFLLNQLVEKHNFDDATLLHLQQMDTKQLQQFALQNELLNQQMMNNMMDPYKTPGIDMIVDESFHGVVHGLGITNQDHHFNNNHMNQF